jgi:hypothetical protein
MWYCLSSSPWLQRRGRQGGDEAGGDEAVASEFPPILVCARSSKVKMRTEAGEKWVKMRSEDVLERNDMVNACNMVTSHCSVKHTSFTTETAQVADLPEMVGPSEVAGGRPERPVEIQCESENPPPLFGETSTPRNDPQTWPTIG